MIFYHGTNSENLKMLFKNTWITSDVFRALDYAEHRDGEDLVYLIWCEEKEVEFTFSPYGIVADYRLKVDKNIIGMLRFQDGRIKE